MITWTCKYCGEETTRVDIDYLVGTDHLSCALKAEAKAKENEFDHCVLCGVETIYKRSTHVDMRLGYIEGAGQLCPKCYSIGTDRNQILIPEHIIYNTPNDQELGAKVRQIYWENKQ